MNIISIEAKAAKDIEQLKAAAKTSDDAHAAKVSLLQTEADDLAATTKKETADVALVKKKEAEDTIEKQAKKIKAYKEREEKISKVVKNNPDCVSPFKMEYKVSGTYMSNFKAKEYCSNLGL